MTQQSMTWLNQPAYQWLQPHQAELKQLLKQIDKQHITQATLMNMLKNQQANYQRFMQHYESRSPFSRWFQKIILKYNSLILFLIDQQVPIRLKKSINRKSIAAFSKINNSTAIVMLPLFIAFGVFSMNNELWQLMLGPLLLMFAISTTCTMNLISARKDWKTYLIEGNHAMCRYDNQTNNQQVHQFIKLAQHHYQQIQSILWEENHKRKQRQVETQRKRRGR